MECWAPLKSRKRNSNLASWYSFFFFNDHSIEWYIEFHQCKGSQTISKCYTSQYSREKEEISNCVDVQRNSKDKKRTYICKEIGINRRLISQILYESLLHIPLFQTDTPHCLRKLSEVRTWYNRSISIMRDYGPLPLLPFHLYIKEMQIDLINDFDSTLNNDAMDTMQPKFIALAECIFSR